jgi:hypothetical protein
MAMHPGEASPHSAVPSHDSACALALSAIVGMDQIRTRAVNRNNRKTGAIAERLGSTERRHPD